MHIQALTIFIFSTLSIIATGLILSLPVMWLWNGCLIGAVAGVSEIGWLQAWGISALCGLLFKTTITKD
jgi:hypothetical protein